MRRVFLLLMIGTGWAACTGNDLKQGNKGMQISKDSSTYTTIEWLDSTNKHFGIIPEGRKLDVSFRFRNSGSKPLIIEKVQPSCGCTIAEQPDAPVLPGNEGFIKASFNSEGRTGINQKTLYVIANTKGTQSNELHFEVEVEKKKW